MAKFWFEWKKKDVSYLAASWEIEYVKEEELYRWRENKELKGKNGNISQ